MLNAHSHHEDDLRCITCITPNSYSFTVIHSRIHVLTHSLTHSLIHSPRPRNIEVPSCWIWLWKAWVGVCGVKGEFMVLAGRWMSIFQMDRNIFRHPTFQKLTLTSLWMLWKSVQVSQAYMSVQGQIQEYFNGILRVFEKAGRYEVSNGQAKNLRGEFKPPIPPGFATAVYKYKMCQMMCQMVITTRFLMVQLGHRRLACKPWSCNVPILCMCPVVCYRSLWPALIFSLLLVMDGPRWQPQEASCVRSGVPLCSLWFMWIKAQ